MHANPHDDDQSTRGVRTGTAQRPPEEPRPANPQARRNLLLLLALTVLLGAIPAGALIYWGYFASLSDPCYAYLFPGQICDFTSHGFVQYTYAQAVGFEMFQQWVDRVVGVVWALLTVRYALHVLRMQAIENAPGRPPATDNAPGDRGAYLRSRWLSRLSIAGIIICVVGVLILLFNPFLTI